MDSAEPLRNAPSFVGSDAKDLPASALVLTRSVVERNIEQLHKDVEALGFNFRPHMSTLKTLEMTRLMLGNGKYRSVVCSTLAEIEGAACLAKEGSLDEAIYGIPFSPSELSRLHDLRSLVKIILLIDNEYQIQALESSMHHGPSATQSPWPVFLGMDVGARWSGVPSFSERIDTLVHAAKASKAVEVLGFHSDARFASVEASEEDSCSENLEGLLEDTCHLGTDKAVIVSIEPTPTYPVPTTLTSKAPANVVVELSASQELASVIEIHPSNPPLTHLRHVPTKFIDPFRHALRLVAEVCSVYPERNEVLVKTGPIVFFKDGEQWEEFGNVVGKPGWGVRRMSRDHCVVGTRHSSAGRTELDMSTYVEEVFKLGEKVFLQVPHSCMAASSQVYFVVNDNDLVEGTWGQ